MKTPLFAFTALVTVGLASTSLAQIQPFPRPDKGDPMKVTHDAPYTVKSGTGFGYTFTISDMDKADVDDATSTVADNNLEARYTIGTAFVTRGDTVNVEGPAQNGIRKWRMTGTAVGTKTDKHFYDYWGAYNTGAQRGAEDDPVDITITILITKADPIPNPEGPAGPQAAGFDAGTSGSSNFSAPAS